MMMRWVFAARKKVASDPNKRTDDDPTAQKYMHANERTMERTEGRKDKKKTHTHERKKKMERRKENGTFVV